MNNVPVDRKYTVDNHQWVLDNLDGTYTLGISDFAQDSLGDLVFVELPEVGNFFKTNESICVVESVKSASDVYAPADIEIVKVNQTLNDLPELVNEDCYNGGWLVMFKANKVDELIDHIEYKNIVELS